tara:strand:- start:1050 stop:1820 length:771 start_codon:yes stop_codon:yes gene_type:complete
MAIEQGLPSGETPSTITIEIGQSKKEAHVCIVAGCTRGKRGYSNYCRKHRTMENVIQQKIERKKAIENLKNNNTIQANESHRCRFDDCQNLRKGYSDFCREHKAIGKIIAGRIAREKAIAKIAEREMQSQNNDISPRLPSSSTNGSNEISIDEKYGYTLELTVTGIFLLLITWFLIAYSENSSAPSEILTGACFTLLFGCWALISAAKDPIAKFFVVLFLAPVAIILALGILVATIFMSSGGGCYGVCGLSGWGGP